MSQPLQLPDGRGVGELRPMYTSVLVYMGLFFSIICKLHDYQSQAFRTSHPSVPSIEKARHYPAYHTSMRHRRGGASGGTPAALYTLAR